MKFSSEKGSSILTDSGSKADIKLEVCIKAAICHLLICLLRRLKSIGEISFSFFLTHWLVIAYGEYVRINLLHFSGPSFEILAATVYLLMTLVLSSLLYLYYERKAKAVVLNWYSKGKVGQ